MTHNKQSGIEEVIDSACLSLERGNLAGWELELIRDKVDTLRKAFEAAKAFIDCHVADPDITDEMITAFRKYKKSLSKLEKANAKNMEQKA